MRLTRANYFNLRNTVWNFLIKTELDLPINLVQIIKNNNWLLSAYESNNGKYILNLIKEKPIEDALTYEYKGFIFILYNSLLTKQRIRFAVAHEIGHIVMQHRVRYIKNYEQEANMFAARLLMPMAIIKELNIQSPEELAQTFEVSLQSATYRFERYQMLVERNKFFTSPLEQKVLNKYKQTKGKFNEKCSNLC